ncbi:hypothetical protein ZWY2020_003755 [Hordeum vulgare]|nr:hypothetical protein ZWY2020_003755 [Hordeum vulgare]
MVRTERNAGGCVVVHPDSDTVSTLRARVAWPGEVDLAICVAATGGVRVAPLAAAAALSSTPGGVGVAAPLVTALAVIGVDHRGGDARRRGVELGVGERDGHRVCQGQDAWSI